MVPERLVDCRKDVAVRHLARRGHDRVLKLPGASEQPASTL